MSQYNLAQKAPLNHSNILYFCPRRNHIYLNAQRPFEFLRKIPNFFFRSGWFCFRSCVTFGKLCPTSMKPSSKWTARRCEWQFPQHPPRLRSRPFSTAAAAAAALSSTLKTLVLWWKLPKVFLLESISSSTHRVARQSTAPGKSSFWSPLWLPAIMTRSTTRRFQLRYLQKNRIYIEEYPLSTFYIDWKTKSQWQC